MDISRDTCYLLTCSIDGDVRLWSLQERACVVATVCWFFLVRIFLLAVSSVEYSLQSPKLPVCLWRFGRSRVCVFNGRSGAVASGVVSS